MSLLDIPNMETKNLFLRETRISDYIDMHEYAQIERVAFYAGWPPHKTYGDTKAVLEYFESKKEFGELGTVAVVEKKSGRMIGTVELFNYVSEFKAELGYTINPKFQNKGYATEASFKVLEWGFKVLKLKRIECNTYLDNIPSIKVCEKLHLNFEGIKKKGHLSYNKCAYDLRSYSITDDEYFSNEYQDYIRKMEE